MPKGFIRTEKQKKIISSITTSSHNVGRSYVTAALMAFHIAPNAECLSTTQLCALEWLLSSMAIVVNLETARPRECFVASLTDITILWMRICCLAGRSDIMMMFPHVRCGNAGCCNHCAWHDRREV
jgi:hypothetical protein